MSEVRPFPPAVLRYLATTLVAGPDARLILDDLDEMYARDQAAGNGHLASAFNYLSATVRSAWATRSYLSILPLSALDLRLAVRSLAWHPVVSVVAVLSMVVGIPVGLIPTLIADSIDAPPPFEAGDQVVGIRYANGRTTSFDLEALRASTSSLSEASGFRLTAQNVSGSGEAVVVGGAEVTPDLFRMLGVPPALGRTLLPSDRATSGPRVALLGHRLWTTHFSGDPDIVGRTVTIGGVATTVVGVMRDGFAFPHGQQLWLPLDPAPAPTPAEGVPLELVARIPAGADVEAMEAELTALVSALDSEHPGSYDRVRPEIVALSHALIGLPKGGLRSDIYFRLTGLLAMSVLAVACINIGLLMYARSVSRHAENSIRSALGASRLRIVGQVFAEALVLSSLSAALGLGLLAAGSAYLFDAAPAIIGALPYWVEPRVTPRLVLIAMLLSVASAVATSVLPAWTATKEMRRPSRSFGRTTSLLVILDIAVAITVAGVAAGVFDRIGQVRSGVGMGPVPAESILAVAFSQAGALGNRAADAETFGSEVRGEIVESLRTDPRVLGIAVGSALPRMSHRGARLEPEDPLEGRSWVYSHRVVIAPGFFEALDIPVLEGRTLEAADTSSALRPAVVNRTFVDSVFAGRAPLGRRAWVLTSNGEREERPIEVVGVVPDAGTDLIDPLDAAAFYEVRPLAEVNPFIVGIRLASNPVSFSPRARQVARSVAPHLLLIELGPLEAIYPDDWILMIAFGIGFSTLLVVLVALVVSGVYAILSFVVTSGRQELGVRRALGANGVDLVLAVTGRLRRNILIGALLGMPGAVFFYRMLKEDPSAGLTVVGVGIGAGLLVVVLVGVLGAVGPVRTALGVAPAEVMKG